MANELVYSGASDLTTSDMVAAEIEKIYGDKTPIARHPVFKRYDLPPGSLTGSIKVALLGDNYMLGNATEITDPGNTAFVTDSATISVAPKRLIFSISDLVASVGAKGITDLLDNPAELARLGVNAREQKLADMFCDEASTLTATVDSSGPLDYATWLNGVAKLEGERVQGDLLALLHPTHWAQLRSSLANVSAGAVQWSSEVQGLLSNANAQAKGFLNGIPIYISDKVNVNATGDFDSFIVATGCMGWASSVPKITNDRQFAVDGIRFELARDARKGEELLIIDAFLGSAVIQQKGGVRFRTNISE